MEFSIVQKIYSLDIVEIIFLFIFGAIILNLALTRRKHIILFILVLSASLVGSTIPVVNSIAPLVRWVSIFLLIVVAILERRLKFSIGYILFLGYVWVGFIFLFRAIKLDWQLQKSVLLFLLSIAILFSYSCANYKTIKLSLVSISVAASIFSILCFIFFPDHMDNAERFSGALEKAPAMACILGGLLPFTFWGLWESYRKTVKITCGFGFFLGLAVLISSGQRTGTIGGIISLIPLVVVFLHRKKIKWAVLIFVLLVLFGYNLYQQASFEKKNFLFNRYSLQSGLSGREFFWNRALSEIEKSPFLGRGIGAAETVIINSFHNAYLEVWFNTGIFGLFMFLTSQLFFTYRSIYSIWISNNLETKSLYALVLGYMLGFMAICITESKGAGASNANLILFLFMGTVVTNKHLVAFSLNLNSENHAPEK